MKYLIVCCLFSLLSTSMLGAEEAQVENSKETATKLKNKSAVIQETVLGMNVSGNKELPNVLYIVPWKGSASFSKPPMATRLVDEIYAPLDPQAFGKKVMFYKQLTSNIVPEKKD